MQKMVQSGNTYYVFDENGDGRSFSFGRCINSVKLSNVSYLADRAIPVDVISILGIPGTNCSDVYFKGKAGASNHDCKDLISIVRKLPNLLTVPLRLNHDVNHGVLQVLFVSRYNSHSADDLSKLLGIKHWRSVG